MVKEELYLSYISTTIYVTGTNTSVTANKLVDSGALFITGATPITIGDLVFNTDTHISAFVTEVDSDTQLTLGVNIFLATPKVYRINKKVTERVELLGSLQPNLTFNISDIKNPDKRKSDFSKSISLPGSKKINKIFEHIFEINLDLQTFNPNLKTDVLYLVNGETIIDGYLQLKEIKNIDKNITYEVTIIGRVGNFINELGNKELTDLDMTSLNHVYNKVSQEATWNYPLSTDYVYPMINYDINYGGQGSTEDWDVEDLFPAITVKKYIDKIFSDVGYTYTSAFFNSEYFENLIIPFSSKNFALTETSINNRIFEANTPLYNASGTNIKKFYGIGDTVVFNPTDLRTNGYSFLTKNTVEVFDPSNIHNPATGVYTVNQDGFYNLEAAYDFQLYMITPVLTSYAYNMTEVYGSLQINKYDSLGNFISTLDEVEIGINYDHTQTLNSLSSYNSGLTPTYPEDWFVIPGLTTVTVFSSTAYMSELGATSRPYNPVNRYQTNCNNVFLESGQQIKVEITAALYGQDCNFNYSSTPLYPHYKVDGGEFQLRILNGYFKNSVVNSGYVEGNTIDMNGAIPLKIKQRDFFMSIVKMFNLYVQSDTQNEKHLLIEPREDFLTSDIVDWSQKLDNSKDVTYLPMGALDSKDYLYKYKEDKDYYNKLYKETWDEVYGQRKFGISNDFLKNEFKTEIIFSPTPNVGQDWYDRVIPTIIKYDDKNGVQRTESNIRILQWAGLKNTQQGWRYTDNAGVFDFKTSYPYAGMYNDPYTPTEDIAFGLTQEIYYSDGFNNTLTLTNNNLFNKYHKKFIEEITDINSKIVRGYFNLNPSDIKNLSFRKQFRFNNSYFRLNKIENYNPGELTMCEFLKIKDAEVFVPEGIIIIGAVSFKIGEETAPKFSNGNAFLHNGNSLGNRSQYIQGDNNYISRSATNINIKGNSNKVYSNALNITIQGDNNVIKSGAKNINLINTNGITISQSNITVIDNVIKGPGSVVSVTTTPYIATEEILTYLVDTTAGNIEFYLPDTTTIGQTFVIKLIEASNTLNITTASGTPRIDGAANVFTSTLYYTFIIRFDGVNYQIISKN